METGEELDTEGIVRDAFALEGIQTLGIERHEYPQEIILVVSVRTSDASSAAMIASRLDRQLASRGFRGFVTVRSDDTRVSRRQAGLRASVADARSSKLAELIEARSRTSLQQPSLSYVVDTERNIDRACSPRHHLIFGRRGTGKTALMVEAKRRVEEKGTLSVWMNLQTLRSEGTDRAFTYTALAVCEKIAGLIDATGGDDLGVLLAGVRSDLERFLSAPSTVAGSADPFIPRLHRLLQRFLGSRRQKLFVFIDELHYLRRDQQPRLLDMLHAIVRDVDAWLKVAGIRHLSKWFVPNPPTGLESSHDAGIINLDITLENPSQAKQFLEEVLAGYGASVSIATVGDVFSGSALDRLVLASGAVPRDYLTLAAGAIRQARGREKAKTVGVQDVNLAAGEASKGKISELEEDAASSELGTPAVIKALQELRAHCIETRNCTYFRVDFHDKERLAREYGLVQDLMDLRLLHLLESSLSDEHHAGKRAEVYMLDLSQFSGHRLRRHLKMLDFRSGYLVLKGADNQERIARSPKQRLGLLRRGPLLPLSLLTPVLGGSAPTGASAASSG
jgi:hypothetical protein